MRKILFNQIRVLGIIYVLGIIFASQSWGQKMNLGFPSPESSVLVRNVNNPVNLNTGIVNVQVPLYSIQEGKLTLPIQLNYQTSGIKVHDLSTWVGLGWSLSAGGKITRIVKKRPDENGFCKSGSPDGESASLLSSWTENAYDSRTGGEFDGEPDLFFYELPGRSGMFVFNPQGKAYSIPYQDLVIEWVDKSYFKIIDENGIVYIFGQTSKEMTITKIITDNNENVIPEYVSTWPLESITSVLLEKITFTYEAGVSYEFSNYDESYAVEVSCPDPYKPVISQETIIKTEVRTTIKPQYLKEISWKGGKLEFISSLGRQDLTNARKLKEIKYFSADNQFVKSVKFSHYNLDYSSDYRLMLREVYDSTRTNKRFVSRFEYSPYLMGLRGSRDYDHWGYYNGAQNQTNRPLINYLPFHVPVAGANRTPSFAHTTSNCLEKVYNNLGGYTEYEYELNDADIEDVPCPVGGLRIKSIKQVAGSRDSLVTRYYYKKYNHGSGMTNVSSGTTLLGGGYCTWSEGGGNNYLYCLESTVIGDVFDLNGSPICYSTVIVENPNGSKDVYDYSSNDSDPDVLSTVYFIPPNSMNTYSNYLIVFANNSRFWKRGLLRKHASYDDKNGLVDETDYYYSSGGEVKGEIKGYQTYSSVFNKIKTRHLCEYKWSSEPVLLSSVNSGGRDVVRTWTDYTYDMTHLLPKKIEQTQSSPYVKYRTTITYPFDYNNTTLSGDVVNASIAWMNALHVCNYPIEKIMYKDGFIVGGELCESRSLLFNMIVPWRVKQLKIKEPKTTYTPYAYVSGTMVCDPDYESISIIDEYRYDAHAPSQTREGDHGKPISVIYGYNNTVPVATVANARYNEVYYTSFEEEAGARVSGKAKTGNKVYNGSFSISLGGLLYGQYVLSYWKSTDNGETWSKEVVSLTVSASVQTYAIGNASCYIDEVRIHPVLAQMETVTYQPGVGKISETDVNGFTVYYEYDGFGRLVWVLDNERKVVKVYTYVID